MTGSSLRPSLQMGGTPGFRSPVPVIWRCHEAAAPRLLLSAPRSQPPVQASAATGGQNTPDHDEEYACLSERGRIKPVAAGRGHKQAAIRRIGLDLLPQTVDMCLQRMGRNPSIVAPDFIQKRLARYHLIGVPIEELDNIHLFGGESKTLFLVGSDQGFRGG